jgi:hypothetical protein
MRLSRRRVVLLLLLLLFLIGAVVISLWLSPPSFLVRLLRAPSPPDIPEDHEVKVMTATVYDAPGISEPIPPFVIPKSHVGNILRWFRPAVYERDPPIFPRHPLGTLRITTITGRRITIHFYWSGVNPPVFTTNGVDYYWGTIATEDQDPKSDGAAMLYNVIAKTYHASVQEDDK